MSDTQKLLLSVVAVVLAAFGPSILPWLKGLLAGLQPRPAPPAPAVPVPPAVAAPGAPAVALDGRTFSGAIEALAIVRNRLAATGCLDEKATAAVEAITHALVSGTDK